jgi:hypothetical protein
MRSSAVSQKFVEQVFALFRVIPAKTGIQNGRMPYAPTKIPGFRVALPIASLPDVRRKNPPLEKGDKGGQLQWRAFEFKCTLRRCQQLSYLGLAKVLTTFVAVSKRSRGMSVKSLP